MNIPSVQNRPAVQDLQDGFSGGLNTVADAFNVKQNQITNATNTRLSQFGAATKRLGTKRTHVTALGGFIQGGFCWRKTTTVEHLTVSNGVFYSGGATWAIPMTWTAKAMSAGAALSSTTYISWVTFRDGSGEVTYLADGGALIKWDGATLARVTTVGTPASISRIAVYNQRLFGVSGADQTIYYSAVNNGDTLGITGSAGGSAVVRTFGNQKLTTLATLRDSLALFHVSGISRFVGLTQDDIAIATGVQGFSSDIGTLMVNSVVVIDGQGLFLSERGAYVITDDSVTPMDTPSRPDPLVPLLSALASTDFDKVNVVHNRKDREVRWNLPGSGVYVFNYRLGAWSGPWNGIYVTQAPTAQWEAIDVSGMFIQLFGSADGYIRQCDVASTYLDDVLTDGTGGSSFTLVIGCRRFFTDRPYHDKSLRWAYIFADLGSSTTATVTWVTGTGSYSYTIPNVSPASFWGTAVWNAFVWGTSNARTFRIPLGGRGTYMDMLISDDGAATSVYSRVELVAYDLGPRG